MKRPFSLFVGLLFLSSSLAPTGWAQSIKPGAEIRVQLLDQLDTGKTQPGQEFSATLAEPVVLDNGMAWPKGTQVKGRVIEVVSSGRLSRPASITLQLTQIGNSPIETEKVQIDGKSHAGRNAALIGGVGALGALIGGISGGGKGAAIGAAAGAGAGAATAAATGKQEIVLRAEAPVSFVVAGNAPAQPQAASPTPDVTAVTEAQSQPQDESQLSPYYEPYAPEQLDNLLAPVALYSDPLLAQVLVAATFPDQIQDAAQWVPARSPYEIDDQPWDVSVKAVAHYPTVLTMLNDRLDWTSALGQAYVYQSDDVMASVQRLRNMAYSQGNLVTTPQQEVIVDRGYIQIVPAQPRMIFVPVYDPGVIYARPVYRPGGGFDNFFSFGTGYAIGAWLNYDLDWGSRRVVYDGWDQRGGGWRQRSRPYVQITNVYVDRRYEQVNVNRNVVDHHVDYRNVERYNSVHRDVTYENRARIESNRTRNEPPHASEQPQPRPVNERVDDRGNDRGNGKGNDFGARNQPSARPEQPAQTASQPTSQRPDEKSFGRANQVPPNVQQPQPQPANERANEGNGRGNDFGARNQPSARPEQPAQTAPQPAPQRPPQSPNEKSFGRANQVPPNVQQPRPQPANERVNEGNGRGNDFGARNQPLARPEQPAKSAPEPAPQPAPQRPPQRPPQSPNDTSFGRANQVPPNVQQPRPQPANERVNEGNGRGNDFGARNQPSARPEQPAKTAPEPPPQARPAAPAATPPSPASAPKVEQQQQHRDGTESKRKDNNGNEKKKP